MLHVGYYEWKLRTLRKEYYSKPNPTHHDYQNFEQEQCMLEGIIKELREKGQ